MNCDRWEYCNNTLNAFSAAIHQRTYGLIRDLSFDLQEEILVVRGDAESYYSVQLAIHTTQQFCRADPGFPPTRLLLTIDGSPFELELSSQLDDRTAESLTPEIVSRRRELTLSATPR